MMMSARATGVFTWTAVWSAAIALVLVALPSVRRAALTTQYRADALIEFSREANADDAALIAYFKQAALKSHVPIEVTRYFSESIWSRAIKAFKQGPADHAPFRLYMVSVTEPDPQRATQQLSIAVAAGEKAVQDTFGSNDRWVPSVMTTWSVMGGFAPPVKKVPAPILGGILLCAAVLGGNISSNVEVLLRTRKQAQLE